MNLAPLLVGLLMGLGLLAYPTPVVSEPSTVSVHVQEFLESKDSPLAPHTEFLMEKKHWKLLIAISAIESQYCVRQLENNCWGITSVEGGYRKFADLEEAITEADALIERWQQRGRWLTVEDMNCHFVVPCNNNWVSVVNTVIAHLNELQQRQGESDVR